MTFTFHKDVWYPLKIIVWSFNCETSNKLWKVYTLTSNLFEEGFYFIWMTRWDSQLLQITLVAILFVFPFLKHAYCNICVNCCVWNCVQKCPKSYAIVMVPYWEALLNFYSNKNKIALHKYGYLARAKIYILTTTSTHKQTHMNNYIQWRRIKEIWVSFFRIRYI